MAISSGSKFTATDFNNLKTKVIAECQTRRGVSVTSGNATAGNSATASLANTILAPMNQVNSTTTGMANVAAGGIINTLAIESAVTKFAAAAKVGTASGCSSGCMGLCQGCSGTCTGSCTGSCSGGCSGCSGSCTGGCGGCGGDCAYGCQGFQSSDYYCY